MAMVRFLRLSSDPTFFQRRLFISSPRVFAEACGEDGDRSATVEFLKNSCGLSSDDAAAAAKKIQLKTTANAKAVLALLTQRGFSKPQIASLVARLPPLLAASPEKTIKPKLDFFRALELSDAEVAKLLLARSRLFFRSVEKTLAPNVELLRSILRDESKVLYAIKKYPPMLTVDIPALLPPRIQALKDHGVPESTILKLLITGPNALIRARPFQQTLELIKKLDIAPSSWAFAHAFKVLTELPKPTWERKVAVFRSLGWSEEQVMYAFGRHPYCMSSSDEKIRKNAEFFMQKLNWGPEKLYMNPMLLSFSLDKRILPRCSVLEILTSKGLLKAGITLRSLMLGDVAFRRKYVDDNQKEVPELIDAMQGGKTNLCSSLST